MPDNPFRTRQGLIVTTLEKQVEKSNKATKKGILRRVFPFQNGISPWHGAEEDPRYAHLHGGWAEGTLEWNGKMKRVKNLCSQNKVNVWV